MVTVGIPLVGPPTPGASLAQRLSLPSVVWLRVLVRHGWSSSEPSSGFWDPALPCLHDEGFIDERERGGVRWRDWAAYKLLNGVKIGFIFHLIFVNKGVGQTLLNIDESNIHLYQWHKNVRQIGG